MDSFLLSFCIQAGGAGTFFDYGHFYIYISAASLLWAVASLHPRGTIMSHTSESPASTINPTSAEFATVASSAKGEATIAATNIAHETTKDAGRVHLGGGMMRF